MRHLDLPYSTRIADLALSPDGQTLAVAHRQHGVVLYDPFDGRKTVEFLGFFSRVRFRDDGRWLAASGGGAALVDLHDSQPRVQYLMFDEFTSDIRFEADDTFTALGYVTFRTVRLPPAGETYGKTVDSFVTRSHKMFEVESPHLRFGFGLGPPDTLIAYDHSVYNPYVPTVFDLAGNRLVALVNPPVGFVDISYAPINAFYRCCGDWFALSTKHEFTIYNWADLAKGGPPAIEPKRRGLLQTLRESFLGPSNETRFQQRYGSLPILQPRHRLPAEGRRPSDTLPVAFLPNGEAFLCRGAGPAIELRDTATGQVRTSWQFQRAWPRALAVAPDGLTAMAALRGGTVVIWDLE